MSENDSNLKRIYLDYAAASPLFPEVSLLMGNLLGQTFANPGAIHTEGRAAKDLVEQARLKVARTLGIKSNGVVFTASGTESNNLVILGRVEALHKSGLPYSEIEIITTKIEHPSIMELLPLLVTKGVIIKYAPVSEEGLINELELSKLLSPETRLVVFSYVNSEVGTVQSVSSLVRLIRTNEKTNKTEIEVILDAAQAPLWLPCDLGRLGVDYMTLDTGKCGGPKGVGILVGRKLANIEAIMFGGGQEGGLRPGTENVISIVCAAEALALAQANWEERSDDVARVRDYALAQLVEKLPLVTINGATAEDRVANNINLSLGKFDTEYAVVFLDAQGIAVSTKSACAGASGGMSQVVKILTSDDLRAKSTLRLTLGQDTTKEDIDYTILTLVAYCQKMESLTQS